MELRILLLMLGLVLLVKTKPTPEDLEDWDGDGILNKWDDDDDNDGVPDDEDADNDNDGYVDDVDDDGFPDYKDSDVDGDGIPDDEADPEDDYDFDNDGILNGWDPDDDNDGIRDADDPDDDNDGILDEEDEDDDNDGIPDEEENSLLKDYEDMVNSDDFDRDGIIDILDSDDDNDGVPDNEDIDDDNDGIADWRDKDDDNDGILDSDEKEDANYNYEDYYNDADYDGVPDSEDYDDDNDGIYDEYDNDDDNDGIPDVIVSDAKDEDDDGDGIPDYADDDDDNDGVPDDEDEDGDNDGIPDEDDPDDDNDGVADEDEYKYEDREGDIDFDDDGIIDYADDDDDNDGVPDDEDDDDDNDGIPDEDDADDDNDGVADEDENKYKAPAPSAPPPTVQGCCAPGTRLELSHKRGGGYTAKCVAARAAAAEEMEKNIIIDGYKLPQCSRGMLMEKVEVATIGTTTTTTTTTTTPEEVFEEEVFDLGNYGDGNPYGWRLASATDVRDNSGYVKAAVKHVMRDWEWCIACLADDSVIHGKNRGHRIETGRSCRSGVGHKIIVKGGGFRQIKPLKGTKLEAPPSVEYGAFFSGSNQLLISDKVFEKDQYCIDTTRDEVGATGLACDMCEEEVVCSYLKKLYTSLENYYMRTERTAVKAFVGEYSNFEEFKAAVEKFIKELWKMVDSNEDGNLSEILSQSKAKISSSFLSKLTEFLFEKLDINWDEEISAKDWFEITGDKEGDKNIGRKLISLPSPLYTLYTRLDQDRDEAISLQELSLFMSRTFTLLDKTEDCVVDLDDVIATLEEGKLPKDLQLGAKLLLQHELTLANHALNRVFKLADSNHDEITAVDEILHFSDFDFIESEVPDMANLAVPNMNVFYYLIMQDHRGPREENNVEKWLETLQNLMMNNAYDLEEDDIICG